MLSNTKDFWNKTWLKYLEIYLKATPRVGIFIEHYFKGKVFNILEIAGGSCRNSRYLANRGFKVVCSDFSEELILTLKKKFPDNLLEYKQADAFNLPFKDNSFDLVFHDGFFIYFNKNDDLKQLLIEQFRISKKYIVFFVHNKVNKQLVKTFEEKARTDKLYDIRFFNKKEIVQIVKNSGIKYKQIKILKFGGFADVFFKRTIKGIPNFLYPMAKLIVPKLYQFQSWRNTERICCIIEFEK